VAQEPDIKKVAHRGASGYKPENSMTAFKKAIKLKADFIELDVQNCKNMELVVIHDDTVDRTTNGKGKVAEKTTDELKELGIPTLEEVLNLIEGKIKINVELKGPNTAQSTADIIKKYVKERGWRYDDFIVSSFNHEELQKFKKLIPDVEAGALTENDLKGFVKHAQKMGANSINVSINKISKKFVQEAHNSGLKVFVWTPNTQKEINKAKQLKVDYICSDFPDKI
jgi:glycerophosphoryl diester phosphodiesterase